MLALSVTGVTAVAADPAAESTTAPRPSQVTGWRARHEEYVRKARTERTQVCFAGDSLTEFWTGTGNPWWSRSFGPLRSACFGLAGDKVQNLLFRLENGELDGPGAALYVVMIGTCNLADSPPNTPAEVTEGIAAVVAAIRTNHPNAKVIVQSILPNGPAPDTPLRQRIVETNRLLASQPFPPGVVFVPLHDEFLNGDGTQRAGLFIDGTHLTLQGYQVWAELILPHIRKALEPPLTGAPTGLRGRAGTSDRRAGRPH